MTGERPSSRLEAFSDAVFGFALMGPLHGWNGHLGGKAKTGLAPGTRPDAPST